MATNVRDKRLILDPVGSEVKLTRKMLKIGRIEPY